MNPFYSYLQEAARRPEPFELNSARELWTNEHTAGQMLSLHFDDSVYACSRSSTFMDRSVEWISSFFHVGPTTSIADFGCGPGRYAVRLARRGARVTGIDFSTSSLDYARSAAAAKGLDIEYVDQDYLAYRADSRFDLILLIMCDYCALAPDQRRVLLDVFRSSLRPQGKVLLDVFSRAASRVEARSSGTSGTRAEASGRRQPTTSFAARTRTRRRRLRSTSTPLSIPTRIESFTTGCSTSTPTN